MADLPEKLRKKLEERRDSKTMRELRAGITGVDFVSNDYLGYAGDQSIFRGAMRLLEASGQVRNGSTGSRLLSGNSDLYEKTETYLSEIFGSGSALIFNSGYDANLGFFSSVPQRGDLIFYDEYIHASMRDGIRMGLAKSYRYRHNNLDDLRQLLSRMTPEISEGSQCYLATEAVFSMDGDAPDLEALISLCHEYRCRLIIDEAHAIRGSDMTISDLKNQALVNEVVIARIITFGKAVGIQGSAILCDRELRTYLLNFARSFIYTTALPPMSVASIFVACQQFSEPGGRERISRLRANIDLFLREVEGCGLKDRFIPSTSAIHSCVIPGNTKVKEVSGILGERGYDVRPILAPTVPEGMERIRFCLHSYNSHDEIKEVLSILAHAIEENAHT